MNLDGLTSASWAARAKAAMDIWHIAADEIFWAANIESSDNERVHFYEIVPALLERGEAFIALAWDPSARVRRPGCRAIQKVAQIAWDEMVPEDMRNAVKALVLRALPALWRLATDDPHARIRAPAIDAIAEIAGEVEGEVQSLLELAVEDPSGRVRSRAVRALARKSKALEHDLELVVDDRDTEVEDALIDVLEEQRSELILPVLWRRLDADPSTVYRREPRDGSWTVWSLIDIVRRYPLDPARARALMLPMIDRDEPEHHAIEAIVEYVDASCIDVLSRIAMRGDRASVLALTALARLGPDAPLDVFAHWLEPPRELQKTWGDVAVETAGFGLAASGRARPGDLDLVVQLLGKRHLHRTLAFAFALGDPRIAAAARQHGSTKDSEVAIAALALGWARDPETAGFIQRKLGRRRREPRTDLQLALALALADPQATFPEPQWPTQMPSHRNEALPLALAIRELGRRLERPPSSAVQALVTGALHFTSLPPDRTLGGERFLLGDVLREAAALLRR